MVFVVFLLPSPSYAQKTYHLEIDEHVFDIEYDFNGDVIAMAIDNELNSLLIGTENVQDTLFQITLPNELIRAQDNEFAILVNGVEVDYSIIADQDKILTFFVPDFTEEVEIIGTYVVPEFPLGVLLVFSSLIGTIVLMQKFKKFPIK